MSGVLDASEEDVNQRVTRHVRGGLSFYIEIINLAVMSTLKVKIPNAFSNRFTIRMCEFDK